MGRWANVARHRHDAVNHEPAENAKVGAVFFETLPGYPRLYCLAIQRAETDQ